ncbi:MAG: TonB family protein [Paludibacteraceae bacterium]|nr:TonB family protein [Paludibacteraceae bacterium]
MTKQTQSHIIALVGTIISMCLVFLLLWWLQVKAPVQMEDEGIVVAFGDSEDGGGMPDVRPLDAITQVEQIPAPAAPSRPSDNDLIVQEDEESLALAKQTEEEAKRKALEEELIRKRREEEARVEAERIAKEKALAEQRAKEQEAINKANQLAALFGQAGTAEGANADNASDSNTSGTKGNPVGKGMGITNGTQWSLYGRNVKRLPKPSEDFAQAGLVVVQIMVDAAGNVTNATVTEGTTISDRATQQLALQAARQAKFTEGDTPQIGKITYTFKLN